MMHVSTAEARARFAELLGRAADHHERFVLTNHGTPSAVLMSIYDFESMQETLELLSNPAARAQVAQAQQELADGKGVPLEDILPKPNESSAAA